MGEAINKLRNESAVHTAAHYPIHRMIYQIIPILEARQRAAKVYQEAGMNVQRKDTCIEIIREYEKQISDILGFQNPVI